MMDGPLDMKTFCIVLRKCISTVHFTFLYIIELDCVLPVHSQAQRVTVVS